jgi:hypothetical protein
MNNTLMFPICSMSSPTSMMNPGSATRQLAGWGSLGFNLTCHARAAKVATSRASSGSSPLFESPSRHLMGARFRSCR